MTIKPTKQTIESTLRICKLSAALILIVIISSNANAIPLTFELSGTVNRVGETGLASLVGGSIKVGDTITGTYTYDTATPNSGSATFGTYTDTSATSGFI